MKNITIIGHGLAGCVLALSFYKRNIPVRLVGSSIPGEASMASSGLITPVTGRKYVKTWMIDDLMTSALDFYSWTEELFDDKFFFPVEIIRFLSNDEAMKAWKKRQEDPEYDKYISDKKYEILDVMERPYGILTGSYRLDAAKWLTAAKTFLRHQKILEVMDKPYEELADHGKLHIHATGAVGQIVPAGIIPNKGEALIVKMAGWKFPAIIKEEVFFIPIGEDVFWIGSYYEPWPNEIGPSVVGRMQLIKAIEEVYEGSFVVLEHLSGIRPTVEDRRPLIGPYMKNPDQYIFNGMGTKGTSLAPYWASKLVDHLVDSIPLPDLVDPARYESQPSG